MSPLGFSEPFWRRVERGDGCWEWTGWRDRDGYGQVTIEGRRRGAHRVAWELTHGSIPDGLGVCHTCDNPPCCRPDHLYLGTQADNLRDAAAKGRLGVGRARGERNRHAKLTEEQVRDIRRLVRAGNGARVVADFYGVIPETVRSIASGRRWAHVTDERRAA